MALLAEWVCAGPCDQGLPGEVEVRPVFRAGVERRRVCPALPEDALAKQGDEKLAGSPHFDAACDLAADRRQLRHVLFHSGSPGTGPRSLLTRAHRPAPAPLDFH